MQGLLYCISREGFFCTYSSRTGFSHKGNPASCGQLRKGKIIVMYHMLNYVITVVYIHFKEYRNLKILSSQKRGG
jgi:hypothetical protein